MSERLNNNQWIIWFLWVIATVVWFFVTNITLKQTYKVNQKISSGNNSRQTQVGVSNNWKDD